MDSIQQAVELARAAAEGGLGHNHPLPVDGLSSSEVRTKEVYLRPEALERARIVTHGAIGEQARYYDMLRTQVLQEMDKKGWQFLAITSPTAACGKSVTACNLAISISRLPQRSALLVDLDLRKPMVATYLDIKDSSSGVLSVLDGRSALGAATVQANIGPCSFQVLPGAVSVPASSEWMASQTMGTLLQTIKREFRSRIVIFDLPPLLVGDDVISILPRMDAVLLVTAAGVTSMSQIKECQKHLQRSPIVRVVVNKVREAAADSYYGYY